MKVRRIVVALCLALFIGSGPVLNIAHAQGCFALELALDHATAAWDGAFRDLGLAHARLDQLFAARNVFRQLNPTAPWPFGLTDGDVFQATFERDQILAQMNSLEATINSLLDQLLDCENPPDCDGAGHILG